MALINRSEDKFIENPADKHAKLKVDAAWIVPTQAKKEETIVQVILFREIEEVEPEQKFTRTVTVKGENDEDIEQEEEVTVPAKFEISDPLLPGYIAIKDGRPYNIGNAQTHMGLKTFEKDLHNFAISVLGATFEKM